MNLIIDDWVGVPILADGLELLRALPPHQVDLLIADLPWGHSKNDWDLSVEGAREFGVAVVEQLPRALSNHGSAYIMIGYRTLAAELLLMLEAIGFTIQNWIIWRRDLGYHPTRRYKARGIHIIYTTADPKRYTFNGDDIRIPQRRKTVDPQANPAGAIPSDVWTDIPELRRNANAYLGHYGQKPEALYERMIKASSNAGDLILDPCAGTFTVGVVADELGRRWLACDNSQRWVEVGCDRLGLLDYYYELDN